MKIVTLSWHPPDSPQIVSGGYRRFYEIAKRAPSPFIIIDRHPTIFTNLPASVQIIEYGYDIPGFLKNTPILFHLLERITTVFLILRQLLKIRPEIIYVPDSELSHLTLPAVIYKWLSGSRLVLADLNVNTITPERLLNVFLHRFSDKTVTISQNLKKDLEKSGIKVTDTNGVGFDQPRIKTSLNKKFDAIYIGRHIPQKGIFDLIKVWDILINQKNLRYKLVTVGNIPEVFRKKLDEKIKDLKLESYITRFENASEGEKWAALAASRIMVFPSHQEGWGIAPMEALSLGLPVVAYDLPVYQESIGHTFGFHTAPVGDTAKFSQITASLLKSTKAFVWKPVLDWEAVAKREWELICQV